MTKNRPAKTEPPLDEESLRELEAGEAELLRGWGEYLECRYPNPDRIGCPTIDILERLARERGQFGDRRTLDHVARCAPCSKQVRELSSKIREKRP